MSAGVVTGLALNLMMLFGKTYPRGYVSWILSGRPYFPVQITLGILLGWVFGRHLWHRSMIWVWILPFAYLCYAVIAIPTLTPGSLAPEFQAGVGQSRFSHYFGWGCGPWNRCIDQAAVTVPFYVAAVYSIGGLLARKLSARLHSIANAENGAIFMLGLWFLLGAGCDFYFSARSRWNWMLLPLASVPAGIGAYLMLLAVIVWRGERIVQES